MVEESQWMASPRTGPHRTFAHGWVELLTGRDGRLDLVEGRQLLDPVTGRAGRDRSGRHRWEVTALAAGRLHGRDVVVSGDRLGTVWVRDGVSGAPVGEVLRTDGRVTALAIGDHQGRAAVFVAGNDSAWGPDAAMMLTVWDPDTGERTHAYGDAKDATVRARLVDGPPAQTAIYALVTFAGRIVTVEAAGSGLCVCEPETGSPVGPVFGDDEPFRIAATTVDDRLLVATLKKGRVRVWSARTGEPVGPPLEPPTDDPFWEVWLGPVAGRLTVFAQTDSGSVRAFAPDTGEPAPVAVVDGLHVASMLVTELDGHTTVVSKDYNNSYSSPVLVWTVPSAGAPELVGRFGSNASHVVLAAAAGRPTVVTGAVDGGVRQFDLTTGVQSPSLYHGCDASGPMVVTEVDSRPLLVGGGSDGLVWLWDAVSGTPLARRPLPDTENVTHLAAARWSGRTVVVVGDAFWKGDTYYQRVRLWDLATWAPIGTPLTVAGTYGHLTCVAVGDSLLVLLAPSSDEPLIRWDPASGEVREDRHRTQVTALTVGTVAGRTVVATAEEGRGVRVWDAATGDDLCIVTGHPGPVSAVGIGRVGARAVCATGGHDGTARVWDLASGAPLGEPYLVRHNPDWVHDPQTGRWGEEINNAGRYAVHAVVVTDWDGRPALAARAVRQHAADGPVLWFLNDPPTPTGHRLEITCIAAGTVAGRAVFVTGSLDGSLLRWDAATGRLTGEPLTVGTPHPAPITCVALAEAGGRSVVVAGDKSGEILRWDAASGERLPPLGRFAGPVHELSVAGHDGRVLVLAGGSDEDHRDDIGVGIEEDQDEDAFGISSEVEFDSEFFDSANPLTVFRCWDLGTGEPYGETQRLARYWYLVRQELTVVDGRFVAATLIRDAVVDTPGGCGVWAWDVQTRQRVGPTHGCLAEDHPAFAVALVDGRAAAVFTEDIYSDPDDEAEEPERGLQVRDLATGERLGPTFRDHECGDSQYADAVTSLVHRGQPVVFSSCAGTLRGWDPRTGEAIPPNPIAEVRLYSLAATVVAGEPIVAGYGFEDTAPQIWSAVSGRAIR
ncbi:WD40 repeat protein [Micromonospora sp. Llam0]|nr:WD40 repeat protein [Micromonospora sp. Llam0]